MSHPGESLSSTVDSGPLPSVAARPHADGRTGNLLRDEPGPYSPSARTPMGGAMTDDSYFLLLSPRPESARIARAAVDRCLHAWELPELADDVRLVTTELVSNAARLGAVFALALSRVAENAVLVEVKDGGGAVPVPRTAGPEEGDGRGLLLVQACATDWGWRHEADGKTVWARCAI